MDAPWQAAQELLWRMLPQGLLATAMLPILTCAREFLRMRMSIDLQPFSSFHCMDLANPELKEYACPIALFGGPGAHATLLISAAKHGFWRVGAGPRACPGLQNLIAINHDLMFRGYLAVKVARVELYLDIELFFVAVDF